MMSEVPLDVSYFPLEEIKREFLKYAPAYAQKEAREAIGKVMDLQMQGVLRTGLYYVVLTDLVGSTKYASEKGNEALQDRVKRFVTASFNAMNDIALKNAGLFVKEIGDAVLFVFHHFPDILRLFGLCTTPAVRAGNKGVSRRDADHGCGL
jgi:class 3 adenylate cyclase